MFNPDVNSKIQSKKKLIKTIVQTILNELFVLNDQNKNEETIEQYTPEQNITGT